MGMEQTDFRFNGTCFNNMYFSNGVQPHPKTGNHVPKNKTCLTINNCFSTLVALECSCVNRREYLILYGLH